ncbi:MAG TPA: FkbM family methyltransferase [Burkholderiales bacterium]|nr:FkbM family methyltransferase [Burkholderiales bacterium]
MAPTLRQRLRAMRIYLKSYALFLQAFDDASKALVLPFRERIDFHPRGGRPPVTVPGACWTMLPTVCRLLGEGMTPSWEGADLKVRFGDFQFHAPPLDKSIGWTLKEIFVDDVYGLGAADLTGQTALDVGAFIGDSTVALASRGAFVHAFEPLPLACEYLRRNVEINGLADRVRVHPVALADREERVALAVNVAGLAGTATRYDDPDQGKSARQVEQEVRMVDAFDYLRREGIGSAQVVKLDCEGEEYALLKDGALLKALSPRMVTMEYHRGGEVLRDVLSAAGYAVQWDDVGTVQGHMIARRP